METLYVAVLVVIVTAALLYFLTRPSGDYWKVLGKKPSKKSDFDYLRRGGGDKKD